MNSNKRHSNEEKILSLFFSEDLPDHLNALEIIKNNAIDVDAYIPACVAIYIESKDRYKNHAEIFLKFIEHKLTSPQIKYLVESDEFVDIQHFKKSQLLEGDYKETLGIFGQSPRKKYISRKRSPRIIQHYGHNQRYWW